MTILGRTVEPVLLVVGLALSAPLWAKSGMSPQHHRQQEPSAAPAFAPLQALPARASHYMRTTNLQMRDVPWQGHELAVMLEWAPERKPKSIKLLARPSAPGALRCATVMLPRSPGRPLVATSPQATGRPAVALARDLIRNSSFERIEVAQAASLAAYAGYARSIRCDGGSTDRLAAELPRFSSLRSLQLGTLLGDQVASALAGAVDLQELTAGVRALTDEGVYALGQLAHLRKLVVFGDVSTIRGQTLPALRQLRCLRVASPLNLRLSGHSNHRQLVHAMVRLPGLEELQFVLKRLPQTTREARELIVQPLTCLPNLRRLGLVLMRGTLTPFLERIASRPLTHLRVSCESLTAENAARLAQMASLRELDLSGVCFDDADAAAANLAKMVGLQRLGIAHGNLTFVHRQRLLAALPGCVIESAFRNADGTWCLLGETAKRDNPRLR